MNNDHNNPAFKSLLKKLQEESWQLELIISGFAIFGLFSAIEPLKLQLYETNSTQQIYKFVVTLVAYASCNILLFNLLFHVLLRGLWIGALGLRYVSDDIDYDTLNYSKKFTNYLKKRVGSFDKYIATLENYCSVIFAISFLLIFYVIAFTFTIITIPVIANYIISNDNLPDGPRTFIGAILIIFICLGMLLTFIDLITQGILKKKQWISKIYFPFYWVFSIITLSFLYRPLLYNFLDNKFGKRLSFLLIPTYILITFIISLEYQSSNYFKKDFSSTSYATSSENYLDQLNSHILIDDVAIQSKVITEPYLNVFVVYSETIEDRIFHYNESLEPKDDRRGLSSDAIRINNSSVRRNMDSLRGAYLKTFNDIYSIKIDSVKVDSEFVFSQHKERKMGFETYVSTKNLKEGKHQLRVIRRVIKDNDTTYRRTCNIPFWYYPYQK